MSPNKNGMSISSHEINVGVNSSGDLLTTFHIAENGTMNIASGMNFMKILRLNKRIVRD